MSKQETGRIVYGGGFYEGEIANGKPHGKGIQTFSDGMRYEGEFRDGKLHGKGIQTFPDGTRYEGEFRHGFIRVMGGKGVVQTSRRPKAPLEPHKPPSPLDYILVAALIATFILGITLQIRDAFVHDEAQEIQDAEDRKKGFHCLSPWNGSHREFTRIVKRRMNDPDSFEHVATRVTPVHGDTGRHAIIMEFRGRNAFGGVVKNTAIGSYSPDCSSARLDGIQ